MNEIRGLQLLCVKTYPFVGITRFRFHGYNLSLNKSPSTPHIDRKGKKKSGKCQTFTAFFALFKQKYKYNYLLVSRPLRFGRLYER